MDEPVADAHASDDGPTGAGDDVGPGGAPPATRPSGPRATQPCPWCGDPFDRASELKDHVFACHDVRVDRAVRSGLFGGRLHRWVQAARHFPLWAILPLNVVAAAIVGSLVAIPTDDVIGQWTFAIALTPSLAALIDRFFDAVG